MVLYDIFDVEEPRRANFSEITALAERIEGYRVVVMEGLWVQNRVGLNKISTVRTLSG